MTQMMLFDAPSAIKTAPIYPVKDFTHRQKQPSMRPIEGSSQDRFCGQRTAHAEKAGCEAVSVTGDAGVQRMGDLARLVLLRYDLAAKRRARHVSRSAARHCAR